MLNKIKIFNIYNLAIICLLITPVSDYAREPEFENLIIINSDGVSVSYKIEIALTDSQKRRGLMFRDFMPEDQGMVFIYTPERVASMWMKNTILSLDMVFIDEQGVIINIAENTTPFSLETISSELPVKIVLELNAGQVQKHAFTIGNKVNHPLFKK
jgi:uncharacterized protein